MTEANRRWWVLAGGCAGLFVMMLDSTIVPLALPQIRHDIDASPTGLQWVMNAYLLVVTVLVVTAGRLGDMFGRKRFFQIGMVGFGVGSALCGAAPGESLLIAGRAVQGAGAAALLTLSLAIVSNAFGLEERARALGVWAGVSAVALAIGPVAGGLLVDVDWRLIFWINIPVCVAGFLIMGAAARESTDPTAGSRIDWLGFAAFSSGLIAAVLAVVQSEEWGWGSSATLGLLAVGLALLAAFWVIERRRADPMIDFELFRNKPYLGASAAAFALVGSYWAVMYFQPQFLQEVLGHSSALSGLLILPVTVPMVVISPFAGRLIARFGSRLLMTTGMVAGTAGLLVLTQINAGTGYEVLVVGYLLFGVALGLVYAPMSTAAMAAMPAEKAGIASGVLAMTRVLAGSLALAVTSAVFASIQTDKLDTALHASAPGVEPVAFADAVAGSTWVVVALSVAGAIATWLLVSDADPPDRSPGADPASEHHHRHRAHL